VSTGGNSSVPWRTKKRGTSFTSSIQDWRTLRHLFDCIRFCIWTAGYPRLELRWLILEYAVLLARLATAVAASAVYSPTYTHARLHHTSPEVEQRLRSCARHTRIEDCRPPHQRVRANTRRTIMRPIS
jgi:hypothetical protein